MSEKDIILKEVHALLCSTKGAITPKKLSDDYYQVIGSAIPFRKLGYTKLEDFLKSEPRKIRCFSDHQGMMFVQAIPQEETAHIQELVARQRKAKSKSKGSSSRFYFGRGGARGGYQPISVPPRMAITRTVSQEPSYPRPAYRQQSFPPANPLRSVVYLPPNSSIRPPRPPAIQNIENGNTRPVPPLMSIRPPALPVPQHMSVYRNQLLNLVKAQGEPTPEYHTFTLNRNSRTFCGKVTVNKRTFSTYPTEFESREEAFEAAAKEAVEKLQTTHPTLTFPETTDANLVAQRVVGIVSLNDQGRGYWSSNIEEKYKEEFKERLPSDWVNTVPSVTSALTFHYVKENAYAVYLSRRESPSPNQSREPIPAQFPEGETFVVHVLVILGVDHVAVRLTNSEPYQEWEDMMNDVELHYADLEPNMIPVTSMEDNKLYLARIEKSWMRVQLGEVTDNDMVRVILVDHADTEMIPLSDVFDILPRFCRIPCQGLTLRLFGLSHVNKSEEAVGAAVESNIKHLLDSHFTAQVVQREQEVSVILFQQGEGGSPINVNEMILGDVVNSLPPITRQVGHISHVTISYISTHGDVYVVSDTPQQNIVDALISMVTPQAEKMPALSPSELNPANCVVHLVQSSVHGWCRAVLRSAPVSDGTIFVQLIDSGDAEIIPMSKIRPLTALSPLLARMPGQATRVRMARVPPSPHLNFTEKAAQRLREMAPRDSPLIMRVVELLDRTTPVVELFQRMGNNNILGALNSTMEMETGLYRPAGENRGASLDTSMAKLTIDKQVTSPISRASPAAAVSPSQVSAIVQLKIPPPVMPQAEQELKVHVCNVSSPFNFNVQSLSTYRQLENLMQGLQEYCSRPDTIAPRPNTVVPGAVFAGRHLKMNTFFRVEVEYNIHGEEYLVHLIDYGDKEVISLTNLRPLTPNFCQLPAQALKARLAGVQPKNGDWGMEEVFIFKELVDNKNLYSFVTSITADNVLQLHMIDTSADIDVIISRYLVDRKLAVLAP